MPGEAKPVSTERQIRARPIPFLLVGVFLLALVTAVGGAVTIIMGFVSPTEFELLGARLSTIHVGGVLVAVGFITALFTARAVQRSVTEPDALPPDEKAERQKE